MNKAFFRVGGLLLTLALVGSSAPAQEIELALNLTFNNPADDTSGGQWQVIAGTDNFGLQSVSFALSGVDATVFRAAPFGLVNDADPAGFSFFATATNATATSIIVSHPAPPVEGEIGEFLGFGTLTNGSPNLPGPEAMGVNVVPGSPEITTLGGLSGEIPFAPGDLFGDPAFDRFATLATGTFGPGEIPDFFRTDSNTFGTVFTSLGTAVTPALASTPDVTLVEILDTRTNLIEFSDFNGDGSVSIADYTLFRDTFDQTVATGSGADGDGSGQIDPPDFGLFVQDFGLPEAAAPAATLASATVVPEPASFGLIALGLGVFCCRSRQRPCTASASAGAAQAV